MWPGSPVYRRLVDDFDRMSKLSDESTIIDFKAAGNPPTHYLVRFRGRGLRMEGGKIEPQDVHEVEIRLGAEYPRARPSIRWKTPILHPNIFGGTVCLGRLSMEWHPGVHLDDLVEILWDYARLSVLNPASAGPGGVKDVATWEELAAEYDFPTDKRKLRDRLSRKQAEKKGTPVGEDEVLFIDEEGVCGLGDSGLSGAELAVLGELSGGETLGLCDLADATGLSVVETMGTLRTLVGMGAILSESASGVGRVGEADIKEVVRAAAAQGWDVSRTTRGHWRFVPVDKTKPIVIASGTPGDWRSFKNFLSQMRKSGFSW